MITDMSVIETWEAWARGWAVSRAAPPPVEEPDGHRVDVGLPGHRVRYLLRTPDTVAARARSVAEPGTWLKTCGPREAVLAGLTPVWRAGDTEYLMAFAGVGPAVAAPPSYDVTVTGEGPVWEVVVTSGGVLAARGRVAVASGVAVFDRIVTEPAHRRRGLGRVVMHRLAVAAGARSSVLLASEAGRGLYGALGRRVVSSVVPAHVPEEEAA
ncbi:GNAT family N-acetyltransferase [Amycolatopsis sp. WQ 127309]|uniref:GNAT family N-acetyltransferase n=1 Tax=Amycolatopsis sp. WQ 127309 TaxID=2932773 RepID=UPI001FF273C9|nr:GNAT family N-acetyltransferase [Amycolatopsis sp. WQ 127309]UOZ09276.1 GNAT family N-acetyltransferase [Amycolatopsis sp. WQ 127309]